MQRSMLFASLNEDQQRGLLRKGTHKALQRGENLYTPYEFGRTICLVVSGTLSISFALPSGKRAILRHVTTGDTCGETACQTSDYYPGWIDAQVASSVIEIPYREILQACGEPQFLTSYLHGIGTRMRSMIHRLEFMSYKTLDRKLACFLLHSGSSSVRTRLNDVYRDEGFVPIETVTYLADYFGNSRESVSRKLSEFEQRELIELVPGGILIKDPEGIEEVLIR